MASALFVGIHLPAMAQTASARARSRMRQSATLPARLARGHAALEGAVRAAGGSALARVKTIRVVETNRAMSPRSSLLFDETYWIAYPNRLHADLNIMAQQMQQIYDGKNGWMGSARTAAPLPANLLANIRRRILIAEGIGIYRAELAGRARAEWLGTENVQDRQLVALQWSADSAPIKLYIDPATRLLAGARYQAATTSGLLDTVEIWDDFRPVAGLKLPFHESAYQAGAKVLEVTVETIQVNVPADPKLFEKPVPAPVPTPRP